MEAAFDRDCSAAGGLFQTVISDMKSSYPIWEDFISKASKLQSQLRTTVMVGSTFLDALQKVADLATDTRGGSRDIGSALTRMCMRHRSIETRLRKLSVAFTDCLINPLQEQMDDWKRGVNALDKDHAKDYKKARHDFKKISLDTLKLQKKAKKGKGALLLQLGSAKQDVSEQYLQLEKMEKHALQRALLQERSHFCSFVSMLQPVLAEEVAMLGEITHLQAIADDLKALTMDPHKLPPASEQVILDLKGPDCTWTRQTPASSPSTTSRKSSMYSGSLNSVNSSDSRSGASRLHSSSALYQNHSSAGPLLSAGRLYSISSHDSGFVSQDAFPSKSPSPMPMDAVAQLHPSSLPLDPPGTSRAISKGSPLPMVEKSSRCHSCTPANPPQPLEKGYPSPSWAWLGPCPPLLPAYSPSCTPGLTIIPSSRVPSWKDWAKPGPYDQPMVNTLKKQTQNPEQVETCKGATGDLREAGEEDKLSRGLPPDPQGSQSPSPRCLEDLFPSEDCDYFSIGREQEVDLDNSSTVLCCNDTAKSADRILQGWHTAASAEPVLSPIGVATIRRTPSTKLPGWRTFRAEGPVPIRTSAIPVRTPSVPDWMGSSSCATVGRDGPGWNGHIPEVPKDPDPPQGDDMLLAIRRGVQLKKTITNDRSAPCLA